MRNATVPAAALAFATAAAVGLLASVGPALDAAAPATPGCAPGRAPAAPERPARRRAAVTQPAAVPAVEATPEPVAAAPESGPWRLTILGPGDAPLPGVDVRGPTCRDESRTGDDGTAVLPWREDDASLSVRISGPVPDETVTLVRRDTVLRIGDLLDLRVDLVDAETGAAVAGDVGIAAPADAPPRPVELLGGGSFRFPHVAARPGLWTSMTLEIAAPPGWAHATWRDCYLSEEVSPVARSLHRTVALRRETVYEIEVLDPDGRPWTGGVAATVQSGDLWTATVESTDVANVWRLRGAARLRDEPTTLRVEPADTWGGVTIVVAEDADGPVRVVLSRERKRVLRCGGCGGSGIVCADPAPLATTGSARVEVVVLTADGRPARGVTVRAERTLMQEFADGSVSFDEQAATKTADAAGRAVFENVEDGDLEIVAFAAGFAWTSVETKLEGGAALRVAVTEDPSPAATVRVVDADGVPVAGARIAVERFRDDCWAAVVDGVQHVELATGPDGTVRLPKIGRRPVDVEAEFGSREAEVHDVAAGDRAEIRLPRAGGANPGR